MYAVSRTLTRGARSGAGNPDQLEAAGARKSKPEIRHERDVAAATELGAGRTDGTLADLEACNLQRSARLGIGHLAGGGRSRGQPGGPFPGAMPFEESVEQIGPEVGQSREIVAR